MFSQVIEGEKVTFYILVIGNYINYLNISKVKSVNGSFSAYLYATGTRFWKVTRRCLGVRVQTLSRLDAIKAFDRV